MTMWEAFYKKVAKVAGTDIRAKQSSYSNAYYGYQSFIATKHKTFQFFGISISHCLYGITPLNDI